MVDSSLKYYCKCGFHCKKYGMNAYYCRRQFLRNPVEYVVPVIEPVIVPAEIAEFVSKATQYKNETGSMSPFVLMRKFKITMQKAVKIMEYVSL